MPGYQLSKADQQTIGTKYMCNSCRLLLRDPMQTRCAHFYCRSCLGSLFSNGTSRMTCVQDQEELLPKEVFPDKFMRRDVQSLVVHCTSMDDECKWKGEVRQLESHTNSCEFLKIPCVHPDCDMLVKKAELSDHLEKDCKCRPESCGFCKRKINHNKMQLHHERECPAYPVECDKCNKDGIPRAKLLEHQDPVVGDCDAVEGPCPFSQIGCPHTEVLSHSQKKEHLEQANTFHTTLVLQCALRMGREMEALLMHNPRMMSRSPQLLTNYDGVISDILPQVQTGTAENRDLREKLREHSERITWLERKLASGNLSASSPSAQGSGDSNGSVQNAEITRRLVNVENRAADHEVLLVENNHTIDQANRGVSNGHQFDTLQESIRRLEQRIDSAENGDLREKCRENSERMNLLERTRTLRNFLPTAPSAVGSGDSSRGAGNLENVQNRADGHGGLLEENNRTIEQANREEGNRRQVDTFPETVRRLERRIDYIEHTLALRNGTLADSEEYIRQQEFSNFNGELLWKIDKFSRQRNQAVSGQQECLYSRHFSTSRYGYHLRACIYLNGDGMGRGTHISVFFVVMHGEYDAFLRWPFRQRVTFMLMDQDNVEHVIDVCRPGPSSSSFQRPRRETNIASGCPMFFPLAELNNHAYVRDDTMFIKVIVDTSDL